MGLRRRLPRLLVGSAELRRGAEDRAADPDPGGPDAAFLERFLAAHGAGPHHFNFIVSDIEATLGRIRALGIEPVGVNLDNPSWKEAFLHPRSAHGIVIQVAQQDGDPDTRAPGSARARPACRFDLIEHHVSDLDGATRLFREALDGQLASGTEDAAELTWPGGRLGLGWSTRMAWPAAGRCTTSASPAPKAASAPATGSVRPCWPSGSA